MGFKCGVVGLPNVGKSTLFNALTRSHAAAAANYPFCTIDPNVGMVEVPDRRLDALAGLVAPQKTIAAAMEFVDIAGLVAGASRGEGLGNRFLAHIREVDAIAHVVRAFQDDAVTHVSATPEPKSDIETIDTELALADMETVASALARAEKHSKAGDKAQRAQRDLLARVQAHLDSGEPVRSMALAEEDARALKPVCLLTAKPVLYIANVGEDGGDDDALGAVQAAAGGAEVVAICATIEAELSELEAADAAAFLDDLGQREAGLERVIRAGYGLLGLHTFFTAGPKEVRAWTVPQGALAPHAAGVIHSDFETGFIRAETIAYDDFIHHRGKTGAADAGKMRLEGKEYVVQDGDVMHFRFNT